MSISGKKHLPAYARGETSGYWATAARCESASRGGCWGPREGLEVVRAVTLGDVTFRRVM